jgi:dTDP-4-amino-4,6-dideoxygalactose transaminase
MPNLNAALGCAQLEQIETFIESKRNLAHAYESALRGSDLCFVAEPKNCRSNYWLNAVICEDLAHRDSLLDSTNKQGVMTRPIWALMNLLEMYRNCMRGTLENSVWLESRVVNLPSSVFADLSVGRIS